MRGVFMGLWGSLSSERSSRRGVQICDAFGPVQGGIRRARLQGMSVGLFHVWTPCLGSSEHLNLSEELVMDAHYGIPL